MTQQLRVLQFDGMHPDTLGNYFSALGLLAAIGQKWPDVRGCWRDRRFLLLHETLTERQVKEYLLDAWQPTRYDRWWGDAQSSKDDANLWFERNQRSLIEVNIMEAQLVGTKRTHFNPVFGNGGVVGRRDFAVVWERCLLKVRPIRKPRVLPAKPVEAGNPKVAAKPAKKTKAQLAIESYLDAALYGQRSEELPTLKSTGTWFAFANKMSNSGQDWFREGRLSPWLFLLAAEGALLLVGDVNRRLNARARPYAVFPFVCDPAQPTTSGEVGLSKGEFWAPLWDCPATISEVRHLLKRGLARIANRSARAPHEFAIAALAAGTDAGVNEFVRFELRQTTSAEVQEAIPREQIRVGGGGMRLSQLLLELDGWLRGLGRFDDNRGGQFCGLLGPVEAAIIRVSERPDDAERWQHLLLLLSRQQARIDRNKSFREKLAPVPWLDPDWFARAWPEHLPCPDEVVLARAIASIGAGTGYPVLSNLFGIELDHGRQPKFTQGDRPPRVVWNEGEPPRVFGQLLSRRLLDAESGVPLPLGGTCLAPIATVARMLRSGDLNFDQVAEWVPALSLIDWKAARPRDQRGSGQFAGDSLLLGLFRPIFHENPHRLFAWLPAEPKPSLVRRILNLIQFGNLEEAIQAANRYYQAAGRSVVKMSTDCTLDDDLTVRLTAALLVPQRIEDVRRGVSRWFAPEKRT